MSYAQARHWDQHFNKLHQTMHFFSAEYLQELLTKWGEVRLELVGIPEDQAKGYPPKWVWRGIVYRDE